MRAIVVTYMGPTSYRGIRLRASTYGERRILYKRDLDMTFEKQAVMVAKQYAVSLFENAHVRVVADASIDPDNHVVIVTW